MELICNNGWFKQNSLTDIRSIHLSNPLINNLSSKFGLSNLISEVIGYPFYAYYYKLAGPNSTWKIYVPDVSVSKLIAGNPLTFATKMQQILFGMQHYGCLEYFSRVAKNSRLKVQAANWRNNKSLREKRVFISRKSSPTGAVGHRRSLLDDVVDVTRRPRVRHPRMKKREIECPFRGEAIW